MPKEYVHFRIAERTAELLAATHFGPDPRDLRGRNAAPLLLGAVFHDVCYYLATPGAREHPALRELADLLHGKRGRDTHALLRAQAAHAATLARADSPLAAPARDLLAGLASHCCADALLHPPIYFLAGDYAREPGAAERHRVLESCLDLAVAGSRDELRARRLRDLLREADPGKLLPMSFLAGLAGRPEPETRNALRRAWTVFARIQALALSPAGALLARMRPFLPHGPGPVREIAALCYPPARSVRPLLALLNAPMSYRHPVTGEERTASFRDDMERAAQNAANLCLRLADAAENESAAAEVPGPDLDTGLPGGPALPPMRHFARPRMPER